jgi:hypothetical protein
MFVPQDLAAAGTSVPVSQATGPAINVRIDTNVTEPGLFTSQYRSSSPYDVVLDYTDSSQTFQEFEVTDLEIVYSDGSVEPVVGSLEFPRTWSFRKYEAVNSNGTEVVRQDVSVLSAEVVGVITRDQDFVLELSGRLHREGGEPVVVRIHRAFQVTRDERTVSRGTLFSDV